MSDIGSSASLGYSHKKQSITGTGRQIVKFTVGPGIYEVIAATVWGEKYYAVPGSIAFVHTLSDGGLLGINLVHGWVSHKIGVNISNTRLVEGPGAFYGWMQNLEADAVTWFQLVYRRLSR